MAYLFQHLSFTQRLIENEAQIHEKYIITYYNVDYSCLCQTQTWLKGWQENESTLATFSKMSGTKRDSDPCRDGLLKIWMNQ